jgi:hypothetical protein
MLKVLMERDLPAGVDITDDDQAAWHARIALNAMTASQGRMHWLCTYATEDRKLFGLVVVESEAVIHDYIRRAGIQGEVKLHTVVRTLDPAHAAEAPTHL